MSNTSYLLEHEDLVFTLLQEYFQKNRPFDMDKIIPYLNDKLARRDINLNKIGIKQIVISLIKQKLIAEGTNLTRADVLPNENRKSIYDYVMEHPGCYFRKVVLELELPNHVVTWHLNILIKFGFIKKDIFETQPLYFNPTLDFEKVRQSYIASKEKSQKILFYLDENKQGLTKTQLAEALSMHNTTITKYLKDLLNIALIIKKESGNKTLYYLNT
jgi:predicted transcriptional regulator